MEDAIRFSLDYFESGKAVCWHLPRGSFADIKKIRKNTRIFEYDRSEQQRLSAALRPRLVDSVEVFAPGLPVFQGAGGGRSSWSWTSTTATMTGSLVCGRWPAGPGVEFPKLTGLKTVGKADAPDFGHAKKKTAGPSVTQLLRGGSNISHYSINWLMIVVNVVARQEFNLEKAIRGTMKYFKGKYAVCWLLPRGNTGHKISARPWAWRATTTRRSAPFSTVTLTTGSAAARSPG